MKKLIMLIASGFLFSWQLIAQNEVDALRYSNLIFGGTARYTALAGAFGAVGADFSTLSTNPAGIGLFKSSEFAFSPSLYVGKTSAAYNGSTRDDLRYNFNLGHAGLVIAFPTNTAMNTEGWRNIQFGFGINRSQNFNNRILLQGNNNSSSLLDSWVGYANGNFSDQLNGFDTQLAFDTWLLDTITGDPTHYNNAKPASGVIQRKAIQSGGSMNEWVFSLGANYDDRLYIGATLGFPFLKYSETSTYTEMAISPPANITEFEEFNYHSDLATTGSGINFKFGLIFKPVDFILIGAAIHTPTYFYSMQDTYSNKMDSKFINGDTYSATSPKGEFNYKLTTPMKMMGSIAFIIGKSGLISADYEYIDYSEARLRSSNPEDFFNANDAVRNKYTTAGNIHLGAEWKVQQFSLRGGYAVYGSPFKSGINDGKRTALTFGFGLRQNNYFLDFAYALTDSKEDYYLYSATESQLNPVKNDIKSQNFMMSLGFKF